MNQIEKLAEEEYPYKTDIIGANDFNIRQDYRRKGFIKGYEKANEWNSFKKKNYPQDDEMILVYRGKSCNPAVFIWKDSFYISDIQRGYMWRKIYCLPKQD